MNRFAAMKMVRGKRAPYGLSLNVDAKGIFKQKYGGAFQVESIPDALKIVQSGKPGGTLRCCTENADDV
jgi:hypothetical protein